MVPAIIGAGLATIGASVCCPGVTETQVDVERATVTVTFDTACASAPDIARAITEAGFPAKARTNGG